MAAYVSPSGHKLSILIWNNSKVSIHSCGRASITLGHVYIYNLCFGFTVCCSIILFYILWVYVISTKTVHTECKSWINILSYLIWCATLRYSNRTVESRIQPSVLSHMQSHIKNYICTFTCFPFFCRIRIAHVESRLKPGLDIVGSAHNTVTPPHSISVIYIEILLFRKLLPFNV